MLAMTRAGENCCCAFVLEHVQSAAGKQSPATHSRLQKTLVKVTRPFINALLDDVCILSITVSAQIDTCLRDKLVIFKVMFCHSYK